ncbi:hypothetical protein HWV62_20642 [Athelia sp. TMB]|nr:hypothetical protein HWV62_20642 [Athelia sp. TMB]
MTPASNFSLHNLRIPAASLNKPENSRMADTHAAQQVDSGQGNPFINVIDPTSSLRLNDDPDDGSDSDATAVDANESEDEEESEGELEDESMDDCKIWWEDEDEIEEDESSEERWSGEGANEQECAYHHEEVTEAQVQDDLATQERASSGVAQNPGPLAYSNGLNIQEISSLVNCSTRIRWEDPLYSNVNVMEYAGMSTGCAALLSRDAILAKMKPGVTPLRMKFWVMAWRKVTACGEVLLK